MKGWREHAADVFTDQCEIAARMKSAVVVCGYGAEFGVSGRRQRQRGQALHVR